MKKNILFIINQFYKGGAEQAYVNLFKNLHKDKYDIDFLIYDHVFFENRIDLISSLPEWVNVCHVYHGNEFWGKCKKVFFALKKKITGIHDYEKLAKAFVEKKKYDMAFSCGEWFLPDFLTSCVIADYKIVWIHNDLSEAEYFDGDIFFRQDDQIDKYIFVSKESWRNSINKYPFLKGKSVVIHNIIDADYVIEKANLPVEDTTIPIITVLSVGNIRLQKNHLREIEVMRILFERGFKFLWLNIGAYTDKSLVHKLQEKIKAYHLEESFILLGAQENPYKYMKKADVIAVLSDYESWSLVITEAKILNKPIVSTKTSGAVEQIIHNETGLLTDFTIEDIVDKLSLLLEDGHLREELSDNLRRRCEKATGKVSEFEDFVQKTMLSNDTKEVKEKTQVLYIIDDINYRGGAHYATREQIKFLLKNNYDVTIYSPDYPDSNNRAELFGCNYLAPEKIDILSLINMSTKKCLFSSKYSLREKIFKSKIYIEKIFKNIDVCSKYAGTALKKYFEQYDIVCVMSEGSNYRKIVSELIKPIKIQWIHTDYFLWSNFNDYTKRTSSNDGIIYNTYNEIVFVSESSRSGFIKKYPELSMKTEVVKNIIDVEKIKTMSSGIVTERKEKKGRSIVTVGRLEEEKAFDRILRIARRLNDDGIVFTWNIIGDGKLKAELEKMVSVYQLDSVVFFAGYSNNPYKYVKSADLFALLSNYEGLPNTIYEAMILGTPVLATNVGGISEQIEDGVTGWLVDNNEESIYLKMKFLLNDRFAIREINDNLKKYEFDLDGVHKKILDVFHA